MPTTQQQSLTHCHAVDVAHAILQAQWVATNAIVHV
jgi:hypothetical protein